MEIVITELSPRQREILFYTALGLTAKQIGEKIFISKRTARRHRQNIYLKLGVFGGAPEAVAVMMSTDQQFQAEVKEAILEGRDKPMEHPRGGMQSLGG